MQSEVPPAGMVKLQRAPAFIQDHAPRLGLNRADAAQTMIELAGQPLYGTTPVGRRREQQLGIVATGERRLAGARDAMRYGGERQQRCVEHGSDTRCLQHVAEVGDQAV